MTSVSSPCGRHSPADGHSPITERSQAGQRGGQDAQLGAGWHREAPKDTKRAHGPEKGLHGDFAQNSPKRPRPIGGQPGKS